VAACRWSVVATPPKATLALRTAAPRPPSDHVTGGTTVSAGAVTGPSSAVASSSGTASSAGVIMAEGVARFAGAVSSGMQELAGVAAGPPAPRGAGA